MHNKIKSLYKEKALFYLEFLEQLDKKEKEYIILNFEIPDKSR